MVVCLFVATLGCSATLTIALMYLHEVKDGITVLPTVFAAGLLGAFVSALRRLYEFRDIFPFKITQGLLGSIDTYLVIYSLIPPIVGGIAAVALYVLFSAGLIEGDLFAEFHCVTGEGKCNVFGEYVSSWQPATASDYGKVLVWGFIAGFSERLVPDMLNRLGSSSSDS
jgi:hypothetical protein